jgi:STAM-binding protein
MRYSILVLNHLPSHPESKDVENRRALKTCQKRVPDVIKTMERIRPELKNAYEEWSKIQASQREFSNPRQAPFTPQDRFAARDPALSWNAVARADILDAGQNQDLAVDLASKEIRRRRKQAGLSEEEEQKRRTAGVWDDWDISALNDEDTIDNVQSYMQAARSQLDGARKSVSSTIQHPGPRSSTTSYRYPSITRSSPLTYEPPHLGLRREPAALQPPRPPKIESFGPPEPPQLPRKELPSTSIPVKKFESPSPSPSPTPPTLPPKTEETQQAKVTFKPAAYLENGEPLRPVFLPTELRRTFLEIASSNTRRGVEMCGILCGTLVNNALFISCLLIPEQRCTPDTCETENEGSMLDYCMSKDLLLVGWIHTHPTQTCFMSSRDLHTHAGYQVMMPESIAIVCAPRHTPSYVIPKTFPLAFRTN